MSFKITGNKNGQGIGLTLPRVVETASAAETFHEARCLGEVFRARCTGGQGSAVILLFGTLGSGKTVFAKGLASGLGIEDSDDVVSPTFTLVNVHDLPSGITFNHVDLYRIQSPDELEGLGMREMLYDSPDTVTAVEWAEKLDGTVWDMRGEGSALPQGSLWLTVRIGVHTNDEGRRTLRME